MKPLQFLFALLAQFIAFEPGKLTELKDKAALWEKNMVGAEKPNVVGKLLKKSEDLWYIQVLFAILFLFGVKSIGNWMTSRPEPLDQDDVDDDDDLPLTRAPRKLQLA